MATSTQFPDTQLLAKVLDTKNPGYVRSILYWERLRKFYEGGQTMRECAAEFLLRRAMEPTDIFADRLNRFSYVNHMRTILGWYVSALFKDPPSVVLRKKNAATGTDAIASADAEKQQFSVFLDDCDGSGRSLNDFWPQEIDPKLLLYGIAYILIDLPRLDEQPVSRLAQQQAGGLLPRLVVFSPQDVIGWDTDDQGNYLWIKLKMHVSVQLDPLKPAVISERWMIFTRTEVVAYDAPVKVDERGSLQFDGNGALLLSNGDKTMATVVPGYPCPHSMSDLNTVPFVVHRLHQIHWIADQIASPLGALLNLENGFNWALESTNLAMLAVFSKLELNKITRGEAAFLQLEPGDRAEFLEQTGGAFAAAGQRVDTIREEIFRLAFLVPQGRSSTATASSMSGVSKQADMMPARDVLSAVGDRDRSALQRVCEACTLLMTLDVDVDVQGLDFGDRMELAEMELVEMGTSIMPITSVLLERAVMKQIARYLLPDANREALDAIDKEIDTTPTPTMAAAAQQNLQNQQTQQKLSASSSPSAFSSAASGA